MRKVHTEHHEHAPIVATVFRDPSVNEYVVRLSDDGIASPDCNYYTDDLEDAKSTAKCMIRDYCRTV